MYVMVEGEDEDWACSAPIMPRTAPTTTASWTRRKYFIVMDVVVPELIRSTLRYR